MKSVSRIVVAVAAVAMVATSGLAALSDEAVEFGKGPATFLMTQEELAQWKTIKDDAAAQAFIDLFWARRDPTPATPANEFRDDFDARVKYADENFTRGRVKGSMSDRGKVLIIMGPPSRLQRTAPEPTSTIQTPSGGATEGTPILPGQQDRPKQLWIYEQPKVKFPLPIPTVELGFIDQYGTNEWKLERTSRTDYVSLFKSVNEQMITQPQLTQAPSFTAPAAPKAPMAAPAAAPAVAAVPATVPMMTTFKTPEYQAAVTAFESAKTNPYDKPIFVSWGEFVTPTGEYFVPVSLLVPKGSGLAAGQEVTFFGVVEDEAGKTVAVFEEPAKLMASRDDLVYDKSVMLPPGKYKSIFGLAQSGKPISMVTTDMSLAGIPDKDAPGVSSLILSNNIYPLAEAQRPTDPYAFGGIKVVPKSDRQFAKSDELWYFFELRNPGKDDAGSPAVQVKIDVEGMTTDGKKVAMSSPPRPVDAQELKGVPGHYGVGSSILLSGFKPGDYTMKVKVTDTVKKASYNLQDKFKVVEGTK